MEPPRSAAIGGISRATGDLAGTGPKQAFGLTTLHRWDTGLKQGSSFAFSTLFRMALCFPRQAGDDIAGNLSSGVKCVVLYDLLTQATFLKRRQTNDHF